MKTVLKAALDRGSDATKEMLSFYSPKLVMGSITSLSGEDQEKVTNLVGKCHVDGNPYDVSLLRDGDRVRHRLTGELGTITLIEGGIFGITFVEFKGDDGTERTVYPDQIIKLIGD